MTDRTQITGEGQGGKARRYLLAATVVTALLAVACAGNDGTATSTSAATDPTSTTAEAQISTTNAGDSTASTDGAGAADESIVMVQTSFEPAEITVAAGTTVAWTNEDTIAHTSTADDATWDSANMEPGDTFEFTFDEPGTYEFVCSIHPASMQGTITVEG